MNIKYIYIKVHYSQKGNRYNYIGYNELNYISKLYKFIKELSKKNNLIFTRFYYNKFITNKQIKNISDYHKHNVFYVKTKNNESNISDFCKQLKKFYKNFKDKLIKIYPSVILRISLYSSKQLLLNSFIM